MRIAVSVQLAKSSLLHFAIIALKLFIEPGYHDFVMDLLWRVKGINTILSACLLEYVFGDRSEWKRNVEE